MTKSVTNTIATIGAIPRVAKTMATNGAVARLSYPWPQTILVELMAAKADRLHHLLIREIAKANAAVPITEQQIITYLWGEGIMKNTPRTLFDAYRVRFGKCANLLLICPH